MANFFQSLFAAIKEPIPVAFCDCNLDAYVPPRDIPAVVRYMKDFTYQNIIIAFGNTDSSDHTHIKIKFKDSQWATNETVDLFLFYQNDLERLIPEGRFVFSIYNHRIPPSLSDIIFEKYRIFLSRWTRYKMKISKRWKSAKLQVECDQ